jgi:hypothetical protein
MRRYEVGFWDIHGREGRAFFHQIQPQSVFIACERCERLVPFPPKTLCASCVSALECGAPASMNGCGSQKALLGPTRPS